jgi:hypothetical protein
MAQRKGSGQRPTAKTAAVAKKSAKTSGDSNGPVGRTRGGVATVPNKRTAGQRNVGRGSSPSSVRKAVPQKKTKGSTPKTTRSGGRGG